MELKAVPEGRWQVVPVCGCQEWNHVIETRVIRNVLKRFAEAVGEL